MTKAVKLSHDWFPGALPQNVNIGERSWLYSSFAFRHYNSECSCGVNVGHDTGLYNGTFFDLGPNGEVQIGNFCTIVGAIIATNSKVTIGDYCFLAHEIVIADSFAAIPGCDRGKQGRTPIEKNVTIGENVWVGARAILLAGAQIGDGAIVGAAAVVDFDVPPHTIVAGNPARVVKQIKKRD